MFWYVLGAIAGGAGLVEGYRLVVKHGGDAAHPILPPGVPQPGGTVLLPVTNSVDGDALHLAARGLLTALSVVLPGKTSIPAVLALQVAYNATNPPVKLKADGIYGAKTQAVVQSLVAPSLAPKNAFGASGGSRAAHTPVVVAKPPVLAALPMPV